jgi:hypothetical protein
MDTTGATGTPRTPPMAPRRTMQRQESASPRRPSHFLAHFTSTLSSNLRPLLTQLRTKRAGPKPHLLPRNAKIQTVKRKLQQKTFQHKSAPLKSHNAPKLWRRKPYLRAQAQNREASEVRKKSQPVQLRKASSAPKLVARPSPNSRSREDGKREEEGDRSVG